MAELWPSPLPVPCPAEHPEPAGHVARPGLGFLLELNGRRRLVSELLFGGYIRRVPGDPVRLWCLSPVSSESPRRSCSFRGRHLWFPPWRRRRCVRQADLGCWEPEVRSWSLPPGGGMSRKTHPWAGGVRAAEPCLPPGLQGGERVAEGRQDKRRMEESRTDDRQVSASRPWCAARRACWGCKFCGAQEFERWPAPIPPAPGPWQPPVGFLSQCIYQETFWEFHINGTTPHVALYPTVSLLTRLRESPPRRPGPRNAPPWGPHALLQVDPWSTPSGTSSRLCRWGAGGCRGTVVTCPSSHLAVIQGRPRVLRSPASSGPPYKHVFV